MALHYNTYYAMPRLENYTAALAHYNHVKPILRDPYETRPLGKRTQKWVSIWLDPQDKKTVCIGYGAGELSSRQTIISFDPSGVIRVHKRTRWSSASCNERMSRVLGMEFKTHQYDTWVRTHFYDQGKLCKGWLPINMGKGTRWDGPETYTNFVRAPSGELVFLDYSYPVTHKVNMAAVKIYKEQYQEFLTYARGFLKLHDKRRVDFDKETLAEHFGWQPETAWGRHPNYPPSLMWGDQAAANRAELFNLMRSGDVQDKYKAFVWLNQHAPWQSGPLEYFEGLFLKTHRDEVFVTEVHTSGELVRDRYKRLFSD